ncbi:MAG TPA: PilZ domain-containing protein [Terriglobales bacterium]|nr:PilZ domain-containing protein [Terriglobales bacterium]
MNPPPIRNERRKWPRLPLTIPVFVRSRDRSGRDLLEFASALNVSAGGALVAVRRSLPLPARVLLEIPSAPTPTASAYPKSNRTLEAQTLRVTHGEGYHLVGLEFAKPLSNGASGQKAQRGKRGSSM